MINIAIFFSIFQEVFNPLQKETAVSESEGEDEGGINITKAQERMKAEDKKDKEIYRQKVKAKHKVVNIYLDGS